MPPVRHFTILAFFELHIHFFFPQVIMNTIKYFFFWIKKEINKCVSIISINNNNHPSSYKHQVDGFM